MSDADDREWIGRNSRCAVRTLPYRPCVRCFRETGDRRTLLLGVRKLRTNALHGAGIPLTDWRVASSDRAGDVASECLQDRWVDYRL